MPKKILLADDSITIQKVVELTFSDGDYEVIAVNNGAKAVQKLGEIRPDIILSDIIMPEKNGYEVCEFVKSRPEFRNIPVILLTGTFEPFDPDRADKAGCDAVVTKPFESQSLIHRVEELIEQSHANEPAPAAQTPADPAWAPAPAPSPEPVSESPFGAQPPAFNPAPGGDAFASGLPAHGADIFAAAAPAAASPLDMPFEMPPAGAFSDETRAFPRMTFEDLQKMEALQSQPSAPEAAPSAPVAPPPTPVPLAPPPAAPPMFEASPWDEQGEVGEETRMFPRGSQPFGAFETPAPAPDAPQAAAPPAAPAPVASPFDSPAVFPDFGAPSESAAPADASPLNQPEESFGDETRAFPNMTLADLQRMMDMRSAQPPAAPAAEPPAAAPELPSPFEAPASADEAPASFSFDSQPEAMRADEAPLGAVEPPPSLPESGPLAAPETPVGETSAFQKMSFADLEKLAAAAPSAEEPEPARADSSIWDEPAPPMPEWATAAEPSAPAAAEPHAFQQESPFAAPADEPSPFGAEEESAAAAQTPFAVPDAEASPSQEPSSPFSTEPAEEPAQAEPRSGSEAAAFEAPAAAEPAFAPAAEQAAVPAAAGSLELTDEQISRIARRVVEMLSADVVKNIAWEVIPDMAEMVVKERIRQLESEA